jgi:hypothetical protein
MLSMARRVNRKQLVLKEKSEEFENEHPLADAVDCAFEYVPPEDDLREMPRDCRRYAHLAQCCETCHECNQLTQITLLNGEVIRVCCPMSKAIRPAYHAEQRRLWLVEHMSTAEGRSFLATTWLSLFPSEEVMFALQAWNETAPDGEKVDFISTLQEGEARRAKRGESH